MSDKEVRVRITGDISDLLNKLERVKDAFNDIGKDDINSKGVNDFIDDLQRAQDEIELIETSLDEVIGTTKKFDDNSFSDMADEFSDANRQVNDLSDSFKELNEAIGDIDTRAFENLNDSMQEIADLDKYIDSFNFDDMTESIRESEDALREFYNTQEKAFDSENNGFVESMETITELGHEAADIYQQIAEQVEEINMDATLDSNKSDSNRFDSLKEGIISGAVAGQTMKSSMEGVADSLDSVVAAFREFRDGDATLEKKVDAFHKLTPAIENVSDEIARLKEEERSLKELDETFRNIPGCSNESLDKINAAIEARNKAIEENAEKLKELTQIQDEYTSEFKKNAGWYDKLSQQVKEFVENEENGIFVREKVAKSFKEVSDAMKDMYKLNDEGTNKYMNRLEDDAISSIEKMEELREKIDAVKKEMKEYQDIKNEFGSYETIFEELKRSREEAEKLAKEMDELYGEDWFDRGYSTEDSSMQNYIKDMEKLYDICKKIDVLELSLSKANHAETELIPNLEHYNKQLQKEQEIYQETKKEIDDLTKSYKYMNKAVNRVNDSGADDLLDNISKKADEAAKSVSLVDFDVLKSGLDKLGERIDDKAQKLIRFQQVNKELNDEMRKTVGSFRGQGNAIKDYADNAAYAIEVIKPLLEGTKLLSSEGFKIIGNDKSLEKKLEQQKQLFRDNIEVIEEYMRVLKDSGSEISKSFFDDSGNFDAEKFLKNIDTFGDPTNLLTMQMESYKRQILENLKHEKESIESTRELARANKESAQSALEVAQAVEKQAAARKKAASEAEQMARTELQYANTVEESVQAAKKLEDAINESGDAYKNHEQALKDLAQAQKEYAEASEKLNNIDRDRVKHGKELVEQYNDQAKALRKMGADIKDITKGDIQDFDKSLGSLFDDIFPDDTPNKLSDFVEDIKAAFSEFKNLEFGNAFDIFKDIGKGLFDKLPGSLKAAVATVTALTVATKKLYDIGKQNFFEGLSKAGDMLQPAWEAVKNIGDEVRDAFENITGMDLDLGSLIEQVVEFEATMAQVGAIAQASDKDLVKLTATARELGGTTRYSATEVGEAMTYMGMAGWSTQEILDGVSGVLNLATAGCIDLGEASDFVTDGLTALNMAAIQSNDFVDMLSATIVSSNTGVSQMQKAFTNVAPLAGTLGISMSDLSVALGLMADRGVKGAKAGTALKNLLANMASPTKNMTNCISKYNLEAAQTKIVNGDLIGGIQEMQSKIGDLTAAQKTAIITTIAGKEALSGIAALMNSSTNDINKLKFAVDSSTKASQKYAQTLGLVDEEGKMVAKTYDEMIETQGEAYKMWQDFNTVLGETTDTMTLVGGSTTDLGAIIQKMAEDGKVTTEEVNNILNAFDKLSGSSEEATAALKKYGIELVRNDDNSLNFGETLKSVGEKWDTLSDSQKKNLASQLGISGSIEDLNELFSDNGRKIEDLIESYEKAKGVSEHLAETFDSGFKGALLNLASAIEEQCLQAFDSMKEGLLDAAKALTEFFNIWNGLSELDVGSGFIAALAYLSEEIKTQSEGWGEALKNGIVNAVKGLDTIINSSTFDNILEIGTNIITGICDGIQQAKDNGSLDRAIDGAIKKICTWIETNAPQIEQAGLTIIESLKEGMLNNEAEISSALDSLCSVINSWAASSGELKAAATTFADTFISAAGEAIVNKGANKVNEWLGPLVDLMNPGMQDYYEEGGGKQLTDQEKFFEHNAKGGFLVDWIKGGVQKAKEWLFGESYAAELGEEIGTQVTEGYNNKLVEGKETTNATANEIGTGISEGIGNALLSMDVAQLQLLQTELTNLQTATATVATGMATSFTTIQNTARTSFMGFANIVRNQMLNVSNIIRNQLLNCTNIVRNQALNMSNIFRNQFVNMTNIVRNQALNMANIIRNQMLNMTNIVRNQALNMSNIFRNQFVNMANIVRNQMVNVANIVRNQMVNCANIVRNQCVNMANIFRNQFVSMANVARNQMVNVSNIIRNQAISWSNVIRNQVTNARNTFTQQMISMASVARTQMVNVSNIVRNQATQWASVVRSQAANMKSAFTSAFSGLSSIAASQMAKCLSVVRSYMSQIRAATAQKMTMSFSVNRTITTTNVTKTKTVAASAAYAMRAVNDSMFALAAPTALATTSSNVSGNGSGIDIHGNTSGSLALEIPVVLDGREIARASSKYSQAELAKLEKRGKRKRGE